jgi:predicted kinase
MKELFLLRGLPGSGKSTLAKSLRGKSFEGKHFEADMYFVDAEGNYKFEPKDIKNAHNWCQKNVEISMLAGEKRIIVSNTFTQEWEMEVYYMLAEKYEYTVYSLIVENRHNGVNTHDCPADKIEIMRNRFEIKL